jgi:PAS domain S-box-containing protein
LTADETMFRVAFEEARLGMAVISTEGCFVSVNKSFCRMLGYAQNELESLSYLEITHQDDQNEVRNRFRQLLSDRVAEKTGKSRHRYVHKTGRSVWGDATTVLVRDNGSRPLYFVAYISEIGESEKDLGDSKPRGNERDEGFRLVVEQAPYGVSVADQEGKVIFANPAIARILGEEDPDNLTGRPLLDFVSPNCRMKVMTRVRQVLEEGKAYPLSDQRILRPDGSEVDVEVTAIPFTYRGRPAIQGVFNDITQRKCFERDLRRSKETIEALLNASTDLVFLLDTDGAFLAVNQALAARLGQTTERLLGTVAFSHLPRETANARLRYFTEVLRTGKGIRFEDQREGRVFDNSMCPVVSDDGKVEAVAIFVRDITENRLAEQLLNLEKQKFQAIAEYGPFGMGLVTENGKCIYINQRFTEILGYELQDIPDEDHWFRAAYPDPDLRNRVYEDWRQDLLAFKPGQEIARTYPVTCKNGSEKTIHFRAVGLGNGDHIISLEDITDRVEAERVLMESERRYRRLFEDSPISLWEEDFSAVKAHLELLRYSGVTDFRQYFEQNPNAVLECAKMVKVLDVNQATLDIYEAGSKEELLEGLAGIFVKESLGVFKEELTKIAEGITEFEAESIDVSLQGNLKHVFVRILVAPGFETNLSKVIVSVVDISDRKQAEESLKNSLREKELLLSEIHHRVKNNLQIISSLLRLQSRHISDPEYQRIFMESQDRVQSMALIHEDLYESRDLGNVDFQGYVSKLMSHLFLSYGVDQSRVRYKVEVAAGSIGIDCAVPCGLLVNELVSNSLKHAFPGEGRGEIGVALSSNHEGLFDLVVWDNGIGLPPGLHFKNTPTLGLRLVSTLVRQLRGKMELAHGPGTKFIISFHA